MPPPHNVGWAVAAVLFFWPLSFSAFSHAFNVYPLWASGNFAGAQYASDRVRRLGQLSLWIAGGLLLLFAILYAIFVLVLISQGDATGATTAAIWTEVGDWRPRPGADQAAAQLRRRSTGRRVRPAHAAPTGCRCAAS